MYSEKAESPINPDKMANVDGEGTFEDPLSGESYTFYVKVEFGIIKKINFWFNGDNDKVLAACSALSALTEGKQLTEAQRLSEQDMLEALDSTSGEEACNLEPILRAFREALINYQLRRGVYNDQTEKRQEANA